MAIEINNPANPQARQSGDSGSLKDARRSDAKAQQAATGDAAAGSGDSVTLTATASQLAELQSAVRDTPEVHTQRVEEIRAAIDEGRFQADPERIAERLLELEEGL